MKKAVLITCVVVMVFMAGLIMVANRLRQTSPKITGLVVQPTVTPRLEVATDPNFPEVRGKLITGFPLFPVYPGATLVASALTNISDQPDQGYRAKWTVDSTVLKTLEWYKKELVKDGWKYEANDPENPGEQVVRVSKDNLAGTLAVEAENLIAIIVDLRKVQ